MLERTLGPPQWRDWHESPRAAQSQEPLALRRAELVAASASLSVLGKSFTEMSLGFYFKGSSSKDLLIV